MPLPEANPQPDANPIVMWELTRACRLECTHCPIGAQQRRSPLELSTYEGYKTIDQIASLRPAGADTSPAATSSSAPTSTSSSTTRAGAG